MTLYNILFGESPLSQVLLKMLGLSECDIPRFRDCFLQNGMIVIHTRTGGGNRDFYEDEATYKDYIGESSYTGPWNDDLRKHPNYLSDKDSEIDATYANFYFSFPSEFSDQLKELSR